MRIDRMTGTLYLKGLNAGACLVACMADPLGTLVGVMALGDQMEVLRQNTEQGLSADGEDAVAED